MFLFKNTLNQNLLESQKKVEFKSKRLRMTALDLS